MPTVHAFDPPERFVAGTVGEPGSRTFFLQARTGTRIISVSCEKQQVALLAERVDELLDELTAELPTTVPALAPRDLADNGPLEQPIVEEFRAGTMTLSWDPQAERVVIEVYPFDETAITGEEAAGDDDDLDDDASLAEQLAAELVEAMQESEPSEMLVVRLAPGHARAFAKRAATVVDAGRPGCPFCGQPIDPDGHLCVRANGFKRRDP